jgi:hypothetical protein
MKPVMKAPDKVRLKKNNYGIKPIKKTVITNVYSCGGLFLLA